VHVEVYLSPSDFAVLRARDLADAVAVVFDVLRATSTFVTALGHGARAVIPVETIEEALEARRRDPSLLLAGERNGLPIGADRTGSVAFDLGNSPREFTAERVVGRTIVSTTTNGTRALRACSGARETLAASFLNLDATARRVEGAGAERVIVVCAGTFEETALEDVLGAGAFIERLAATSLGDGARIALETWKGLGGNLEATLAASRNGAKLLSIPDLAGDVPFCAGRDAIPVVATMDDGGALRQRLLETGQVEIPSRL
jgi:2-phosphosulfolactate phosphatase